MKKALAGVLVASLVGLMAVGATAQVPNIQIYFNGNPAFNSFNGTQEDCKSPNTLQDLYVVMNNWNMFVQAVDFSIDFPASGALLFAGETAPLNTVVIGSAPANGGTGGIAIAWNLPQNGFVPLLALTVRVLWTAACECGTGPQALQVRGYNYAIANANPLAVRWPDFVELEGVGMTSLVCPGPIATEQTTWGGVKALYR